MTSQLQEMIDAANVVSFDMFDTLVHRSIQHPHHVHQLTQMALRREVIVRKFPVLGTSFKALRCEAESTARKERMKYHGDTEVTIDDIYTVIGDILGVPREELRFVVGHELKIENLLLYPDVEMKEAFLYARSKGKKVIITSDMYLSETNLRGLLSFGANYENLEDIKIYSSCDYRASKYTGKLYDIIIRDMGTSKILHIGDNLQSDIAMANAKGLATYHHENRGEQHPAVFAFDNTLTTNLITGIITKLYHANPSRSTLNHIGIGVFGPLVTGYLIWLLDKLTRSNYDSALFFARDTYVLYKIFSKHLKDCEDAQNRLFTRLPPIDYVYISRAATALPALFDFNIKKLPHLISGREPKAIGEWLKLFGISEPLQYIDHITSAGFESQFDVVESTDSRIPGLLQSLYAVIQQKAAEESTYAQEYFSKFIKKNLAVIDIGWSGSLQQNLSKILNLKGDNCHLDGYYFNLWTHKAFSRRSLHDSYSAYLQDYKEELYANLPDLLHSGGMEVLECVLSAPHGTTLGYFNGEPLLEEVTPSDQLNQVQQIQQGIEEFFDELVPFISYLSAEALSSIDWTRPYFRMMEFPTIEEAESLGDFTHSNSAGETVGVGSPLAPKLNIDLIESSKDYVAALNRSTWKQAFIVRNG